jgi:hypothetical protein
MANQEHLEILKRGVEVWNEWREQRHPALRPDLSEADLIGANLIERGLATACSFTSFAVALGRNRNAA